MTDKLLANGLECSSALAADTLVLRQFQQDFFLGQVCGHLFKGTLLLSGMSLDSKGFLGGFFCFVVLLLLRLIEQTHLVFTKDIGCLLTGLAKPGSLGVGKDFIHMIQLALQFVDLSLLGLNLALLVLNRTLQNSHFRSGVCSFLLLCGHERVLQKVDLSCPYYSIKAG